MSRHNAIRLLLVTGVIASLVLVIYSKAFRSYQTDDYGTVYRLVDSLEDKVETHHVTLFGSVIATGYGGKTRVHWTPLSVLATYFVLDDDRLLRVLAANLFYLTAIGVLVAWLSGLLGASFGASLFAAALVSTSQALVFVTTSAWGSVNFLAPLFTLLASACLWQYLGSVFPGQDTPKIRHGALHLFLLFFFSALLCKEPELRSAILVFMFGVFVVLSVRSRVALVAVARLYGYTTAIICVYFLLRYFLSDAEVPLFRSNLDLQAGATYHHPRLEFLSILNNSAQLLFGSISPINNYDIFLELQKGMSWKLMLLVSPGVLVALTLVTGWVSAYRVANDLHKRALIFIALAMVSSLFPEAMLGKVSEIYAMVTLWPLGVAVALIFTILLDERKIPARLALAAAVTVVTASIIETSGKVTQYMRTAETANSVRQSMAQLTDRFEEPIRILVLHHGRSKQAFGPFGEKGVFASEPRPRISMHEWEVYEKGSAEIPYCDFDLILKETVGRDRLEIAGRPAGLQCASGLIVE